jgi:hypothetical protein
MDTSRLRSLSGFVGLVAVALLAGCAHPILLAPDIAAIDGRGITPIKKHVGY